jgi:hypothetical protein
MAQHLIFRDRVKQIVFGVQWGKLVEDVFPCPTEYHIIFKALQATTKNKRNREYPRDVNSTLERIPS